MSTHGRAAATLAGPRPPELEELEEAPRRHVDVPALILTGPRRRSDCGPSLCILWPG
jgi:hypothetical protein